MRLLGFIATLFTGGLLLYAVTDFPDWGDPESPANDGVVSNYYIEEIITDTKVPNLVTAVLADYRGYDTMFETVVILTAGIAIMAILRALPGQPEGEVRPATRSSIDDPNVIVGTTVRLLTPVIQLFALYVIAHGHHSPGGGFQGGVILGASFILLAISKDLDAGLAQLSEKRYLALAMIGVLIYGGFGLVTMYLGANFLDYQILHKLLPGLDPVKARYHSMLGVEIGVAFTVTAIMFAIYANLSSRGRLRGGL